MGLVCCKVGLDRPLIPAAFVANLFRSAKVSRPRRSAGRRSPGDAPTVGEPSFGKPLKALILEWTPKSKWAAVCEEISSGAKAHSVDFLKGILNRRQCSIPDETAVSLEVIKREWITNLRYVGALIPFKEAEFFIEHVTLIYQWAERST